MKNQPVDLVLDKWTIGRYVIVVLEPTSRSSYGKQDGSGAKYPISWTPFSTGLLFPLIHNAISYIIHPTSHLLAM